MRDGVRLNFSDDVPRLLKSAAAAVALVWVFDMVGPEVDPLTVLAAFAPMLVDAGKSIVNRWIAPEVFKPATVEQWALMQDKQLAMFQAVNAAGASSAPSYLWVEAIIKLQRPFVVAVVLLVWAWSRSPWGADLAGDHTAIDNAAAIVGFYLFGDRTLLQSSQRVPAPVPSKR